MAHRYQRKVTHQPYSSFPTSARTSTTSDEIPSPERVNSYFLKRILFLFYK